MLSNQLILKFEESKQLAESSFSVEPNQRERLEKRAKVLFNTAYASFLEYKSTCNTTSTEYVQLRIPELQVVSAECAFANKLYKICDTLSQSFLDTHVQKDQLYCRALLLQGLLWFDKFQFESGAYGIYRHQQACKFIETALETAASDFNRKRYAFLAYNCTVALWRVIHSRIRPTRARYFVQPLKAAITALEAAGEQDTLWCIEVGAARALALDDADDNRGALEQLDKTIAIAAKLVADVATELQRADEQSQTASSKIDEIAGRIRAIRDEESSLNDMEDKERKQRLALYGEDDIGNDSEALALSQERYNKRQELQSRKAELQETMQEAQSAQVTHDNRCDTIRTELQRLSHMLLRLHMQKVYVSRKAFVEAKKVADTALPLIQGQGKRAQTLLSLQCVLPSDVPDKEVVDTLNRCLDIAIASGPPPTAGGKGKAPAAPTNTSVPANVTCDDAEAALEVARVAVHRGKYDIADRAVKVAEQCKTPSPSVRVQLDLCRSMLSVRDDVPSLLAPRDGEPGIGKNAKKLSSRQLEGLRTARRIEAVKTVERALASCVRLQDPMLLQEACVMAWNLCLPLLQPHLRKHAHRCLQQVARTLSDLVSPLSMLRSQVHLEVARCESAMDFVARADTELGRALSSDYGDVDNNDLTKLTALRDGNMSVLYPDLAVCEAKNDAMRKLDRHILPFRAALELRGSVYDEPETLEDQAALTLQQAKEASSRAAQRELLARTMLKLLSIRAQENGTPDPSSGAGEGGNAMMLIPNVTTTELDASCVYKTPDLALLATNAPSPALKRRMRLFADVASKAWDAPLRLTKIAQMAAVAMLETSWHPVLSREFVVMQVGAQYILTETIVETLKAMDLQAEGVNYDDDNNTSDDTNETSAAMIDARSLGLSSHLATERILSLKKKVIQSIVSGIKRAQSVQDAVLAENGAVYLWNLHLHVFRKNMYHLVLPELFEALSVALEAAKTAPKPDYRLVCGLAEALSRCYIQRNELDKAIEVAKSVCDKGNTYDEKRLAELICTASRKPGASAAPAGGKGAPAGVAPVSPTIFNDKFLQALGNISIAELPDTADRPTHITAAHTLLSTAVLTQITEKQNSGYGCKEDDDHMLEMQVEAWCRLAAVHVRLGSSTQSLRDAQDCAYKCANLLPRGASDSSSLPQATWRWASCAERYWGASIAGMIASEGQDESLQAAMRLAALRHHALACTWGKLAMDASLVIDAATEAWNICTALLENNEEKTSILSLLRQVLDAFKEFDRDLAGELKQQLYCAMASVLGDAGDYRTVMEVIDEAFEQVSTEFQRPLWRWRVICMSRLGKSVLDGLQKMKEADPLLQSKVWAVVGRMSSDRKQQMTSLLKAAEVLTGKVERADALMEVAEWMTSTGLPRTDAKDILECAVEPILEVEEKIIEKYAEEAEEDTEDKDDESSFAGSRMSRSSRASRTPTASSQKSQARSKAGSAKGSSRGGGSRAGSKTSKRGSTAGGKSAAAVPDENAVPHLNMSQLDIAVRVFSMMAVLVNKTDEKIDAALRAVHYVQRSYSIACESIVDTLIDEEYARLPAVEQDKVSFDDYTATVMLALEAKQATPPSNLPAITPTAWSALTRYYSPPVDGVAASFWSLDDVGIRVSNQSVPQRSDDVLCKSNIGKPALSFHYLVRLADVLVSFGMNKYALLCLSWCRLLLSTSEVANYEAGIASITVRCAKIFTDSGMTDAGKLLLSNCTVLNIQKISEMKDSIPPVSAVVTPTEEIVSTLSGNPVGVDVFKAVRPHRCLIDMGVDLMAMGDIELARHCFERSLPVAVQSQDVRGQLLCVHAIAQQEANEGKITTAIRMLSEARPALVRYGDASMSTKHIMLLSECLGRIRRNLDALQLVEESAATMRQLARITLDVNAETDRASTAASTSSRTSTPKVEENIDCAVGALSCVLQQCNMIVQNAIDNSAIVADLIGTIDRAHSMIESCIDTVSTVAGLHHSSIADACIERAMLRRRFIAAVRCDANVVAPIWQRNNPAAAVIDEGAGRPSVSMTADAWTEAQLNLIVRDLEHAVAVLLHTHEVLPPNERVVYVSSLPKDAVDTKNNSATIPVSSSVSRRLALSQCLLASANASIAEIRREHESQRAKDMAFAKACISPVDRYLYVTRPRGEVSRSDFAASLMQQGALLTTTAQQLLKNSMLSVMATINAGTLERLALSQSGALDDRWEEDEQQQQQQQQVTSDASIVSGQTQSSATNVGTAQTNASKAVSSPSPVPTTNTVVSTSDNNNNSNNAVDPLSAEGALVKADRLRVSAAIDTLTQGIKDAISLHAYDDVYRGCLALVDMLGKPKARDAIENLLLAQSCFSRNYMEEALLSAMEPESKSALALKTLRKVRSGGAPGISPESPQLQQYTSFLNASCPPWASLDVQAPVKDIVQQLPRGTLLLTMQLSVEGSFMYIGLVSCGDTETSTAVDDKSPCIIQRIDLNIDVLQGLVALGRKMQHIRKSISKFLAKQGDEMGEGGDFLPGMITSPSMSSSIATGTASRPTSSSPRPASSSRPSSKTGSPRRQLSSRGSGSGGIASGRIMHAPPPTIEDACEAAVTALVQDMKSLLAPILGTGTAIFNAAEAYCKAMERGSPTLQGSVAGSDKSAKSDKSDKTGGASKGAATGSGSASASAASPNILAAAAARPSIVFLPDPRLAPLPLEALQIADLFIGGAARDFSVHVLNRRCINHTGLFEPVVGVRATDMRFAIDPLAEDTGATVAANPRPSLSDVLDGMRSGKGGATPVAGASTWVGVTGQTRVPSLIEWCNMMGAIAPQDACRGLLVMTPGKLPSFVRDAEILSMSLRACRLMIVADRAHNDTSYRRQSSEDNTKDPITLERESPDSFALWLSLAGARTVVLQRWDSSFYALGRLSRELFQEMSVNKGLGVGAALRKVTGPSTVTVSNPDSDASNEPMVMVRKPKLRVALAPVIYGLPQIYYES